ncbi:hypothetical protein RUND412_008700 [Rhizina undulata]
MDAIKNVTYGFIDFEGQRLAELLTTTIIVFAAVVAFLAGYVLQDLTYTLYIGLSGAALTFVAVVPPWPIYNKDPLTWLPNSASSTKVVIQDIQEEMKGKKSQ